jgi:two-component system NtrC family sensor kinase
MAISTTAEGRRSTREQMLEAIIASSLNCIIVVDSQGRVVEFNPAAERTFGYRRDEAIGRLVSELIVPERHRAAHAAGIVRAGIEGAGKMLGRRVEVDAVHADGHEFPVEVALNEVHAEGQRLFLASLRDLTLARQAEQALRESEATLAGFMSHAPIGMYLKDAQGRYIMANPQMARVFGLPTEELIGRSAADLLSPEEAAMVAGYDREVRERMESTAVEEQLEGRTEYEWTLVVRFPVDRGKGIEIGGFDIDITALKTSERELQHSREALMQAEKLAAMGSLLAGVSHELNNPLAAVVGNAIILEEELAGHPEAERVAKIRAAAERCGRIVKSFLDMARQRPPVRSAIDLNDIVREALSLADYGLRTSGIRIEQSFAPDLPAIWADRDQIYRAVVNLVINAQHALETRRDHRRLRASTWREEERVVAEIADNGPGVEPGLARRIFEPFFTTKPMGAGTGVGLSSALGIVEAHGGVLELVESEEGATFRITLPIGSADQAAAVEAAERPADAAAHVLVVDDEEEVAETLRDMLGRDGYRVSVANSAAAARELLAAEPVDLLLSDLRMTGEDGMDLFRWLSEADPGLAARTIFVTGDTLGAQVQAFLAGSGRPVLEKPFTRKTLRAALAALSE